MPPDFYFRGALVQFWQATYTEYNRLSAIFGTECFEFFIPDPKAGSLADYEPKYYDEVHFLIWEAAHRDFPVRIRASRALGSELVEMHVSIYVSVIKTYGETCLDVWQAYITSLDEQGFLIKPADFLPALPSKPLKPKSGADLDAYFDLRQQKLKLGQKYSLTKIAAESGFGYAYVRQLHSAYLRKQGLSRPKKRTNKRTNKN